MAVLVLAGCALLALAPWLVVGLATPRLSSPAEAAGARLVALTEGVVRAEEQGPAGPTLVLLHGFNEGLGRWEAVWERLGRCPVRSVRLDLPGFGASAWRGDEFGLPAQAARVVEVLDRLGLARVTLVGTSMGGSLAAWLAATRPERVERLLLLAPSGYPGALTYPGLYGQLLKPGAPNAWATRVARTPLFRALFPHSAAVQALTVSATYGEPWEAALAAIAAPTLLVWSRGDSTASAAAAEQVAARIPGSRLLWVAEEAGHSLPSSRPELTASLACQLAQGVAPAALVIDPALLRPGDGSR